INSAANVHGACAEWIAGTARHEARQIWLTLKHFSRWDPVRPFRLAFDRLHAGPGETFAADTDAIADGLAPAEDVIEIRVRRIDHDGAGRFARRIIDKAAMQ